MRDELEAAKRERAQLLEQAAVLEEHFAGDGPPGGWWAWGGLGDCGGATGARVWVHSFVAVASGVMAMARVVVVVVAGALVVADAECCVVWFCKHGMSASTVASGRTQRRGSVGP